MCFFLLSSKATSGSSTILVELRKNTGTSPAASATIITNSGYQNNITTSYATHSNMSYVTLSNGENVSIFVTRVTGTANLDVFKMTLNLIACYP